MPRIPTYQSNVSPPNTAGGVPMNPGAAVAPWNAVAGVGQQMEQSALYAGNVFASIQRAERTVRATSIQNQLQNSFEDAAQGFKMDTDFVTMEDRAAKIASDIRNQYSSMVGDDPVLAEAVNAAIDNKTSDFMRTIRDKKISTIVETGKGAFQDTYNRAIDDASGYEDPKMVQMERDKIVKTANEYVQSGILTAKEGVDYIDRFDATVKKLSEDKSDVAADKLIESNPAGAADILRDKNFLPMLPEKVRQDKVEKAAAAKKVFDNELESKRKEALKVAHDEEERTVGDLYMKGEYSKAFAAAQNSKLLTGDEKKTWADSIETKLKAGDNIDPVVQANEIVKINGMISREEDPDKIRAYVVQTPNMKKEDKEQYLNKLETKLSADENEGRRIGYARIRDIIIPKRGILNPLTETPQETMNVRRAQDALDEWIDIQKKGNKYPTSAEIRAKADMFANSYQVPLASKMEEIERGAKKTAEEMKAYSEQKVEYDKIPEVDRKTIEQELIKSGFPTTMQNVLGVYKRNYLQVK